MSRLRHLADLGAVWASVRAALGRLRPEPATSAPEPRAALLTLGAMAYRREHPPREAEVTLAYRAADPLAVILVFRTAKAAVRRTLARDALLAPFLGETTGGAGDLVTFRRGDDFYLVELDRIGGAADTVVTLDAQRVAAFLAATADLVPYGAETVDWTAEAGHFGLAPEALA